MPGRGDNNKKGSSGRRSSNQSNLGFGSSAQKEKSNHGEQTGGRASERQPQKSGSVCQQKPEPRKRVTFHKAINNDGFVLSPPKIPL